MCYYDNKMAILQLQLLWYVSITFRRRIVNAHILSMRVRSCALRACGLCVYNYNHVICCVQQLFLIASSYRLFNL